MLVSMEETRWWRYVKSLIGNDTFKAAASRAGFNQSAFSRWSRGAAADPAFAVKLARAYGVDVLEALVEAEFITEAEAGRSSAGGQAEREVRKNLAALESAGTDYARAAASLSEMFASPAYVRTIESITAAARQAAQSTQPLVQLQRKMEKQWAETAKNATRIGKSIAQAAEPLKEFQAVYDAMTEAELELIDAGKAPDIVTMEDLEVWRASREPADKLAARRERRAGGGDESTPAVPAELYAADSTPDEDEMRWEYGEDPLDQ